MLNFKTYRTQYATQCLSDINISMKKKTFVLFLSMQLVLGFHQRMSVVFRKSTGYPKETSCARHAEAPRLQWPYVPCVGPGAVQFPIGQRMSSPPCVFCQSTGSLVHRVNPRCLRRQREAERQLDGRGGIFRLLVTAVSDETHAENWSPEFCR